MGLRRHGALGPSALAVPQEEASGSLGPRPLSAQARTSADPPTHQLPILWGFHPTPVQTTDSPAQPAALLTAKLKIGVRQGKGLSTITTWFLGGLISLTHACVCELPSHI
jgi:hypothetical protein